MPVLDGDGNEIPLSDNTTPAQGYPVRDGANNIIEDTATIDSSSDTVNDGNATQIELSNSTSQYPVQDGEGNNIIEGTTPAFDFLSYNPIIFLNAMDTDTIQESGGFVTQVDNQAQDALHGVPNNNAAVFSGRTVGGQNFVDSPGITWTLGDLFSPRTQDHTILWLGQVDDYNWRRLITWAANTKYEISLSPPSWVFLFDNDNGGFTTGRLEPGRIEPDPDPIIVGCRKNGATYELFMFGNEFFETGVANTPGSITNDLGPVIINQSLNCAFGSLFVADYALSNAQLNEIGNEYNRLCGVSWTDF